MSGGGGARAVTLTPSVTGSGEVGREKLIVRVEPALSRPRAGASAGVKYVEVSCKTNHQVHLLERTVLRAVRLLASPDGQQQRRKAKGASKEGPGAFDALKQAWAGVGGC